jgi:hypothetical protein
MEKRYVRLFGPKRLINSRAHEFSEIKQARRKPRLYNQMDQHGDFCQRGLIQNRILLDFQVWFALFIWKTVNNFCLISLI